MPLSDIAALYSPPKKVRVTGRAVHACHDRRRRRRPHGRGSGAGSQSKAADRLEQEQLQHPSRVKRTLNQGVGEGSPAVEHRQLTTKCCTTPSPRPLPASSRRHRLLGRPPLSGFVRPESAWAMATPDLGQGDKSKNTKIHWRAAARGERESERQGGGA